MYDLVIDIGFIRLCLPSYQLSLIINQVLIIIIIINQVLRIIKIAVKSDVKNGRI